MGQEQVEAMLAMPVSEFLARSDEAMDRIPPDVNELTEWCNAAYRRASGPFSNRPEREDAPVFEDRYQALEFVLVQALSPARKP